jgi:2-C-methyl-D-erythritol 4-phosphate cytidylyltransferase
MNIALIMAGGMGLRIFQNVPKQFLTIFDKPIIIYTLEAFQQHPDIESIIVPCLDGWHEILQAYAKQYGITKLHRIVKGGDSGQESMQNGINALKDVCGKNDIIVIHDGIRPMVTTEIISDSIVTCRKYGSGLASLECAETFFQTKDGLSSQVSLDRSGIIRAQTPQAYRYDKLLWAYKEAEKKNITNTIYASTLMTLLGEPVYFSLGSEKNFKITTFEDIELVKAYYLAKKEGLVK